jgi:hypothetical protein
MRKILFVAVVMGLAAGCQTFEVGLEPAATATAGSVLTLTPVDAASLSPTATAAAALTDGPELPTITPSPPAPDRTPWALPAGFSADVYLPPVPISGQGAVTFGSCPDPDGLEEMAGFPKETAIDLINNLWSGDGTTARLAADPALWPLADQPREPREKIALDWFDGRVQPAARSAYADMLAAQCGETVVSFSWTATICPGPCATNTSESLKEDYFMFWRRDTALIWAVIP